jgi:hypothetical protein
MELTGTEVEATTEDDEEAPPAAQTRPGVR